jgi:propanol-preferring alcohol dehydrogenase
MTEMMRGVAYRADREAEVIDYPKPRPGPGQALIQMKAAAICGSDLHRYRVASNLVAGKEPWVPGHEPAGVVAELGPGCTQVHIGQRVAIFHWLGCGHCKHCLAGMHQWCEQAQALGHPAAFGPDADYMVVAERNCLPLPDALSYEDGALIACIAGTNYSALRKLQPSGEDTVAIFGQGPVGLMGSILTKAYGARVIGLDISEPRLALATQLGVDAVVNPAKEKLPEAVHALTGGQGADAALETSGSPAGHQGVIDVLRRGGRAVLVGFGASAPTVDLCQIIGKQLTLMGSHVMPIHYYWDLVDFILEHDLQLKFRQLVTHRFPLEQAAEAFRVADSATAGKVMLVWE